MTRRRLACVAAVACGALVLGTGMVASPRQAAAFVIELKGAAPLRIERQRSQNREEHLLAEAPDPATLAARLETAGVKPGQRVFLRVFKAESQLEIWFQGEDKAFFRFATYPVCFWSGTLGPKLKEGDWQTPEGFYAVTRRQLHRYGKRPRSLNLGFPNRFDRRNGRTGSYILVHGGCSSVGCFSMTNAVMAEIYDLVRAALYAGQRRVHLHVFPFRMTGENMSKFGSNSEHTVFWQDLKPGYDHFEQARVPPVIAICRDRYVTRAGETGQDGDPGEIKVLKPGGASEAAAGWNCPATGEAGPQQATSRETATGAEANPG